MDWSWDITQSSLFTGAGTPWAAVDQRPGWYTAIDWDPRNSEFFREVYLPTVEGLTIAVATVATGGVAGVALGAGMAVGAAQLNSSLGIEQKTFYGQYAPLLGSLGGSLLSSLGVSFASAAAEGAATQAPAWITGVQQTAGTLAPVGAAAQQIYQANQTPPPPVPKSVAAQTAQPTVTYNVQAQPKTDQAVLIGGVLLLALALKKR